jgi:hypothetical protein
VAVLSFLQPIARGWARYRWPWSVRSIRPTTFHRPLAPEHWRPGRAQRTVDYAASGTVDRYRFLAAILEQLDQEGWQWKPDTGWSECDAEIFGPRWSRLRLVTVAEEVESGQSTLRCRLTPSASLRARVLTGVLAMGVLLVLEAWVGRFPWLWFSLLLFVWLAWRIEAEKQLVRRLVAALVDEVAGELGLRIPGAKAAEPSAGSPQPRR